MNYYPSWHNILSPWPYAYAPTSWEQPPPESRRRPHRYLSNLNFYCIVLKHLFRLEIGKIRCVKSFSVSFKVRRTVFKKGRNFLRKIHPHSHFEMLASMTVWVVLSQGVEGLFRGIVTSFLKLWPCPALWSKSSCLDLMTWGLVLGAALMTWGLGLAFTTCGLGLASSGLDNIIA